jgi:hypothetical protein
MKHFDILLFILTGLFIIFFGVVRYVDGVLYDLIASEDGPVEYLTALWFLMASAFAVRLARIFDKNKKMKLSSVVTYLIALLFLMACFEEVSWLQRLFNIEPPEIIMQINTHKETNLHNMRPIQHILDYLYMIAGFYGMFSGLVYDLCIKEKKRFYDGRSFQWDLLVIPSKYAILFAPVFVDGFGWHYKHQYEWLSWIRQADEEYAEFLFAWGCLLYILHKFEVYKNYR